MRLNVVALAVAASVAACVTTAPAPRARPHVVLILADDLGWANVGWHRNESEHGYHEVQTPKMDALVRSGIELDQAYTYKFCSPSRRPRQRMQTHAPAGPLLTCTS